MTEMTSKCGKMPAEDSPRESACRQPRGHDAGCDWQRSVTRLQFERTCPDVRGWWARKRGPDVRWFFVETFTDAPPGIWNEDTERFDDVGGFCFPLARWAGPVEIQEPRR